MATGIGEVASIAGIIGFAFQSVEAIIAINDFCKAYKGADAEALRAATDLELLRQVLVHIESTAHKALTPSKCSSNLVVFLHDCVARCRLDVQSWAAWMKPLELKGASGVNRAWKKVKIAADGKRFASISTQATVHVHRINTCLALIDCGLDLEIRTGTQGMSSALANLSDTTNDFRSETSDNFSALSNFMTQTHDMTHVAFGSIGADLSNISATTDAHTAIAQASQRLMQQLRSELHDEFRQVKNKIDDMRTLATQQHALVSAGQLDTNTRLSAVQVEQVLTRGILSRCLDYHSSLRRLRFRCARWNLGVRADFSSFIHTPKLTTWSTSHEYGLVALQSPYSHRVQVLSFGITLIDELVKAGVPTIWAMSSPRKEKADAESLAMDVLRGLVRQALLINSKLQTEGALAKIGARLTEATTATMLLSVLATALHGLPLIYVIVDTQFLLAHDPVQVWPLILLNMLQEIKNHDPYSETVVKVLLVTYRTGTAWRPRDSVYKDMVIRTRDPGLTGTTKPSDKSMRRLIRGQRTLSGRRPKTAISTR